MGNRKRGRKGHGFQAQQRPPGSRTTDVDNEHGCRSSSRSSRGRLSLSGQNLRTPSTMLKTRFKTTKVFRLTSSALSSRESTLHLSRRTNVRRRPQMQIFDKTRTGKIIAFEGIQTDQQRLIFAGIHSPAEPKKRRSTTTTDADLRQDPHRGD